MIWEMLEWLNSLILRNQNVPLNKAPSTPIKLPRVVFDDCLVLQREHWIVPLADVPFKGPNQQWQYHLELNAWRQQWAIPAEAFVTATNSGLPDVTRDRKVPQTTKLRSKPQFVAFENPLLTGLFNSFQTRSSPYIRIEEVLPGVEDLVKIGREYYSVELNVQWGNS
jgi:hypothetical protein